MASSSMTLIVVAAFDDSFSHNLETYKGGDVVVMDTSEGGHPSSAYIKAFYNYDYPSYLFIQDSMKGVEQDVVQPFREEGSEVVAWGLFHIGWDSDAQQRWVEDQYPETVRPPLGIFGPTFYATREALEKSVPHFPLVPENRIQAQGTERAWAYTFEAAGIKVGKLGDWSNHHMTHGPYPCFRKIFAGRP